MSSLKIWLLFIFQTKYLPLFVRHQPAFSVASVQKLDGNAASAAKYSG
jgi:hypothetical protein